MVSALLSLPRRRQFRRNLLRWFDREKRTLPWRGETDPYRIVVSEIMLQQTRVAVVEARYKKFLKQFPSVFRLARADEDSVLAAWSGLGYYRRARNLHAAARQVQKHGSFPDSAAGLEELPGIGRYTAAAVASIAFGEPVAVVDGNVKRVLQRLIGTQLSDRACWQTARELLEERRPGDFNQAMMELGATICLPATPACTRCPVTVFCKSRGANAPVGRPVLRRKKSRLSYLYARRNGAVLLEQRSKEASLMPGMWELPLIKGSHTGNNQPVLKTRHSITTTDYTILVFSGRKKPRGKWIPLDSVGRLPLTGLARKILHHLKLL